MEQFVRLNGTRFGGSHADFTTIWPVGAPELTLPVVQFVYFWNQFPHSRPLALDFDGKLHTVITMADLGTSVKPDPAAPSTYNSWWTVMGFSESDSFRIGDDITARDWPGVERVMTVIGPSNIFAHW
jgi:hypothetical protein